MAYSANQTKIYCNGAEIPMLMEVPELGGAAEKIDVTTLADKSKRYIPGIRDHGDLMFKFLYDNSADGNFRTLKGLEEAETVATFRVVYPDNTAHAFSAIPCVKMDAGAINGALTFSATMLLQSDIDIDHPSA